MRSHRLRRAMSDSVVVTRPRLSCGVHVKGGNTCDKSGTFVVQVLRMYQKDLFEQTPTIHAEITSLTVKKGSRKTPSNEQSVFIRSIKKVEKLRREIDVLRKNLDAALARHTIKVSPLEVEATKVRGQILDLLYPYYTDAKGLPAKDRRILGGIIRNLLDGIIGSDDEALERHKAMFKAINGEQYDDVVDGEMEWTKNSINQMFAEVGFDFDLGDVDLTDAEAVARKMRELQEKVQAEHERREQQTAGRKKTKRQLTMEARAEEMEKARNRSLSAIYKQLARSFHPDLEQDETLKKEKEELMKQLTSAYEAQDLHTLLKLEAQWLSSNSANIQSLTEEKLSIYNAVLKEQVAELEVEYHRTFGHPRFAPLMQYGIHLVKGLIRSIDHREEVMRMTIGTMHESIEKLKGKDALKEVRACIRMVASI